MKSISIRSLNEELISIEKINGVLGTAIVNKNGLLLISRLPDVIERRKFGAMGAFLYGVMESLAKKKENRINHLTVEFDRCKIIAMAGKKHIILCLVEIGINFGLILMELEQTLKKIDKIL